MIRIFCLLNWHTWELTKGNHRVCKHCGKRQSYVRVGDTGGWQ